MRRHGSANLCRKSMQADSLNAKTHNSKFPHYAEDATSAFQRVSLAYQTLSKPSSRRAYDLSGAGAYGGGGTMGADGLDSGPSPSRSTSRPSHPGSATCS